MVRIRISVPIYSFIMKYLLFSTFIFLQLHLLSQNFSITEQLHWGTTSLEYLRGVERTSDGGYLMFGQAKVQNNSITDTMYGYEDYFVMKLDNNKNLLWNKTYGGSGSDQAISLLKLLNGNYILIGSSRSSISGTKTAVNYGEFDTWVVCINENGEQLWDKSYGTLDNESFGFAINIDQNKIELLINSRGDVSGNKTVPSKGDVDGWLVEIDTLGTILNQHVYGGADEDYFNIIKPLNNGNYMLDCSSRSGVWVGGGTIHGPQPHLYKLSVPKKVRTLARKSALSLRFKENSVVFIKTLPSLVHTNQLIMATENKVPQGYSIVKITHNDKTGHDFMRTSEVERTTAIYAKANIEITVVHNENEEYEAGLVGEKDPEQLRRIGSITVSSLGAKSSCCN